VPRNTRPKPRNEIGKGEFGDQTAPQQQRDRVVHRHIGAGDGGARAAVGLITSQSDGALAQQRQVGDRAQAAADQALISCVAGRCRAQLRARCGYWCARQHAVLGRSQPRPRPEKSRHFSSTLAHSTWCR
jgi:hypothetical protein